MADLIDAHEIIGDLATARHDYGTGLGRRQTVSLRTERDAARFALRFLENCPDEASVIDLREAIQSAYPA